MALNETLPLGSGGLISFIIWAAICIAGFFLLCKLPRFDCAFEFFSKALVALVVGMLLAVPIFAVGYRLVCEDVEHRTTATQSVSSVQNNLGKQQEVTEKLEVEHTDCSEV